MTKLLVSVRSAAEAEAALAGGAALIDVKEPTRGSLGAADRAVIEDVLRIVAGRCPVSAAFGELAQEKRTQLFSAALAYAKWGLAGCGGDAGWREKLRRAADRLPPGCRPVAVAYADWERAAAPAPNAVCEFASSESWGAFLLDTAVKDGTQLLDWISLEEIDLLTRRCHAAGVPVALAGSLGPKEIRRLLPLAPDWFAVRGAVCQGGLRTQTIDEKRVRRLVDLLGVPVTATLPTG